MDGEDGAVLYTNPARDATAPEWSQGRSMLRSKEDVG